MREFHEIILKEIIDNEIARINLSETNIGININKLAKAFEQNSSVKELKLFNCNLGDEEAIALATMLKTNTSIITLDLGKNNINDRGATALGEALIFNNTLQEIFLEYNPISNRIIQLIFRLNPSLKKVIYYNQNTKKRENYSRTDIQDRVTLALIKDDVNVIQELLETNIHLLSRFNWGNTLLHLAVAKGANKIIRLLLAKMLVLGVPFSLHNARGEDPQKLAKEIGKHEIDIMLEKLLKFFTQYNLKTQFVEKLHKNELPKKLPMGRFIELLRRNEIDSWNMDDVVFDQDYVSQNLVAALKANNSLTSLQNFPFDSPIVTEVLKANKNLCELTFKLEILSVKEIKAIEASLENLLKKDNFSLLSTNIRSSKIDKYLERNNRYQQKLYETIEKFDIKKLDKLIKKKGISLLFERKITQMSDAKMTILQKAVSYSSIEVVMYIIKAMLDRKIPLSRFKDIPQNWLVTIVEYTPQPNLRRNITQHASKIEKNPVVDISILLEMARKNEVNHISLINEPCNQLIVRKLAFALKKNFPIKRLNLNRCHLNDNDVIMLAEALKENTSLVYLNLGYNEISNRGATELAKALMLNATLKEIVLEGNEINDATSLILVFKINRILTYLDLSHNPIEERYYFWRRDPSQVDSDKDFLQAIVEDNIEKINEHLLRDDFLLFARFDQGNTALHFAAKHNRIKIIRLLLAKILANGISPNFCNVQGKTPIYESNDPEIGKLLYQISQFCEENGLHAIESNLANDIYTLSYQVNTEAHDGSGSFSIYENLRTLTASIDKNLLLKKLELDISECQGVSSEEAIASGKALNKLNYAIIKHPSLEHVTIKNLKSSTMFFKKQEVRSHALLEATFVTNSGVITIDFPENKQLKTAFHQAAEVGLLKEIEQMLSQTKTEKEAGVSLISTYNGTTALRKAADKGHLEVVQYLISQLKKQQLPCSSLWPNNIAKNLFSEIMQPVVDDNFEIISVSFEDFWKNHILVQRDENNIVIGDRFELINKMNRDQAEKLFEQTGIKIQFPPDKNEINPYLSQGAYGRLGIAWDRQNQIYVAVKEIKGKEKMEESAMEAELQKKLKGCSHVMPLIAAHCRPDSKDGGALYQFMPLAGFGDGRFFSQQLAAIQDEIEKRDLFLHVAHDLLMGIQQMHERGIYHLDIKPDNFMLDMDGQVFVIDFGCAQELGQLIPWITSGGLGDAHYFSPQRLAYFRYHWKQAAQNIIIQPANEVTTQFNAAKADAWSLGVTLFELYYNYYPFDREIVFTEKNEAGETIALPRLNYCDTHYFEEKLNNLKIFQDTVNQNKLSMLIHKLLDSNPIKRLSVGQALHYLRQEFKEYFTNVKISTESIKKLKNLKLDLNHPKAETAQEYFEHQLADSPTNYAVIPAFNLGNQSNTTASNVENMNRFGIFAESNGNTDSTVPTELDESINENAPNQSEP